MELLGTNLVTSSTSTNMVIGSNTPTFFGVVPLTIVVSVSLDEKVGD